MTGNVEKIVQQVRALPEGDLEEFLSWLADYQMELSDEWDKEIERDSQPGGRLNSVLTRVHSDIAFGKTKALDEVIDNS